MGTIGNCNIHNNPFKIYITINKGYITGDEEQSQRPSKKVGYFSSFSLEVFLITRFLISLIRKTPKDIDKYSFLE
ncbi:hypothetical protein GCM10011350_09600 [Marinomonas arctica]|nr:hypothetical protein GCM10011350_09600 [Marinomonas arctica]